MLALDLDGTLLGPDGRVSAANRAMVWRAREAGMFVTLCTGRGLAESRVAIDAIEQADPVIVAGGAMIACPATGRTLHRFGLNAEKTRHAVRVLIDHGHPALVLKDPLDAGYDYLVVSGPDDHPLDPVTAWWFREMNVRVRFARSLDEDEHPEHTVRVGACASSRTLGRVEAELIRALAGELMIHNFPAVVAPEHTRSLGEGEFMHIIEMFDKDAHKWTAVSHLAAQRGIRPEEVVAIGDQINDTVMIAAAGLGVAMGNAVEEVSAVAKRRTLSHAEDGVAHAIGRVLSGEW